MAASLAVFWCPRRAACEVHPVSAAPSRRLSAHAIAERVLPIAILAVSLTAVPVMIFSNSGLYRLNELRVERAEVDEEISRLSQEIRQLRAQVKRIKEDPAAVERVARDELGLIRKTEVVYQFRR